MKIRKILKSLKIERFFQDNRLIELAFGFNRIYQLVKNEKLSYLDVTKEKITDLILKTAMKNKEDNYNFHKYKSEFNLCRNWYEKKPNDSIIFFENCYNNFIMKAPLNVLRKKPIKIILGDDESELITKDSDVTQYSTKESMRDPVYESTDEFYRHYTKVHNIETKKEHTEPTCRIKDENNESNLDMFQKFCDSQNHKISIQYR
jgi:hypothetical protein